MSTPKNKHKFTPSITVIPLAFQKMPAFKEVQGKEWVYYGEKNNYPQYLLDMFYKCSKHGAIVNGKVKYISGAGWENSQDIVVNTDNEKLNSFTHKVVMDCELYNGFAIEVIWTAGGSAEFRHVDFSRVRSNKDNSKFFYASSWHTPSGAMIYDPTQDKDWTVYEPFDPEKRKGKQLIYYKDYSPGLDIYPLPEYKQALLYIELEYQIANYWFNRVKHGFSASAILNFYMGKPTDDEMKKLEEKIKAKFAGTDNAGQFIMNFASGKDFAADVQQLQSPELSKEYDALNTTLQTEIFTGHGVTNGMLFGIKEPGQLGGRTELIEANELFQNRYVSPKQLQTEELFSQYIFPYIKVKGEMKLKKQEPIGYMFSESTKIKYLPERAIAEMVAQKMGIDLKKYPEFEKERKEKKEAELNKKQEFSAPKEKFILEHLRKSGKKRNGKVLKRTPVTYEMAQNLSSHEEQVKMEFERKVMPSIIVGGPTKTISTPSRTPTEIISVVYAYDWIPGFDDSDLDTSREFCVDLRSMTNEGIRWTREDIEGISTTGYDDTWSGSPDVWSMRGGWYNDNGVNKPSCRHTWVQEVIRETI